MTIPSEIPVGMVVAVWSSVGSDDFFWIAKVTNVTAAGNYKLRYYKYNISTKAWAPGRGKYWKGTCSHGAIIHAGINFNENQTITAAILRHINNNVTNNSV